jgi:YhcH/YjgK/YiaL family protein
MQNDLYVAIFYGRISMIFDRMANAQLYSGLGSRFERAFEFIAHHDFEKAAPGRYTLKDTMYYMVQNYETKPASEGFFETHRDYIDLQYVIRGREFHGFTNSLGLKIREPYDPEKDVIIYDGGTGTGFILNPGFFAIYFPEDAHMPNIRVGDDPEKMIKVVVKIPVK